MRILFPMILCMYLYGQNYQQIAHISEGGQSVTTSPLRAYDANRNGRPELYYFTYKYPYVYFTRILEYRPYNRFLPIDTCLLYTSPSPRD